MNTRKNVFTLDPAESMAEQIALVTHWANRGLRGPLREPGNRADFFALLQRFFAHVQDAVHDDSEDCPEGSASEGVYDLSRRLELVAAVMDADPLDDYHHHVVLEMAKMPTKWEQKNATA